MDRDEELYTRLKSGDLNAFDVLYERHKTGLFSFIYSYLRNTQEAEEVFHEAFMKLLKEDVAFEDGSFRGWLYLIARNTSLNRIRSKKRWDSVEAELLQEPGEVEMESEIISRDLRERLRGKLKELPQEFAEVVNMRLSGLTNQEISQVLKIPVGTVKSRFHSLVDRLRMELNA